MMNQVLEAIKNRRSVLHFEATPVNREKIRVILEAGRWAPSYVNSQPWRFIVITDEGIKQKLSSFVAHGIGEAPVSIVVCVDPTVDPLHFIEDGAVAAQNMALAAYSLGLHSSWIGPFNLRGEKESVEEKIKDILEIPRNYRVISLLPIGVATSVKGKTRKPLAKLVYRNKFGKIK